MSYNATAVSPTSMQSFLVALGLDPTKNYSMYSVLAAFFIIFVTQMTYIRMSKQQKLYDLAYPRNTTLNVDKAEKIDAAIKNRILRTKAAAENGFETIGFYAAAITAANAAGVDKNTLNTLAATYLVTRVLFVYIYIVLQENRNVAPLRTVVWFAGNGVSMSLYVMAAKKWA